MASPPRIVLLVCSAALVAVLSSCGGTQSTAPGGPGEGQGELPEEGAEPAEVLAPGTIGVTAQPDGVIHVDGEPTAYRTPVQALVVEPGDRQIQVLFDGTDRLSDARLVRVRPGTNANLFFRERAEQPADPSLVEPAERTIEGDTRQGGDGSVEAEDEQE